MVQLGRHYAFGKNWLKYSQTIDSSHVESVTSDLAELLNIGDLKNKSVLDIGCGSGVHDVGFYHLGCRNLTAIDYDLDSIVATEYNLEKFCPDAEFKILQGDILSEEIKLLGTFDIVYSWGVLHHTGNLEAAIDNSASLVADEGFLAIALYRKTLLCDFWKIEKKVYSRLPRFFQRFFELIYISTFALGLIMVKKISIVRYIKNYSTKRGMNFFVDVRDWLGGYPYESISSDELRKLMSSLGFSQVYSLEGHDKIGIFGSGCDEFLFQKL
jgi:SAM-dependent methyltransferase